jgi:hypothetical protein
VIGDTDMAYSFASYLDEKAWLFHRGRWSMIKKPLFRKELLIDSSSPRRPNTTSNTSGIQPPMVGFRPNFSSPTGLLYIHMHTVKK